MTTKDGGPAFPVVTWETHVNSSEQFQVVKGGVSLRAYFAGQAMIGMLAEPKGAMDSDEIEWIAQKSVAQADALLRELEK